MGLRPNAIYLLVVIPRVSQESFILAQLVLEVFEFTWFQRYSAIARLCRNKGTAFDHPGQKDCVHTEAHLANWKGIAVIAELIKL